MITQSAFAFAVVPFIVLYLDASFLIWSRVYFYCIIGVVASVSFLSSPAKGILVKRLKAYQKPGLHRTDSRESLQRAPTLGVPDDPEREIDEIIKEVKQEIERRRREGVKIEDVKEVIREKLEELRATDFRKVVRVAEKDAKGEGVREPPLQLGEGKKEL